MKILDTTVLISESVGNRSKQTDYLLTYHTHPVAIYSRQYNAIQYQ